MKLKKNCKWLITRKKKWMEIYKNFHKAPFNICRTKKKENDRKLHSEGKITFRILLLQTFLNKKNCSKLIFTSCLDKKRCDSKKMKLGEEKYLWLWWDLWFWYEIHDNQQVKNNISYASLMDLCFLLLQILFMLICIRDTFYVSNKFSWKNL